MKNGILMLADSDVVVSSRVRLARNFKAILFQEEVGQQQERIIAETCEACLLIIPYFKSLELFRFKDISPIDKQVLVEKHLISRSLPTAI